MDSEFVLTNIRTPRLNITCDQLLETPSVRQKGWLRRKRPVHSFAEKIGLGSLASGLFGWESCFVILHNGCLYVFKDEKQKKPDKAFSLFGYTQVLRAGEIPTKDVAWPFKIVYVLDTDTKVHYFGAASEIDMKNWMAGVKTEMMLANSINPSDDETISNDDDYSDLETPVSTRSYFRSIKNLKEIKNRLGQDSDLEDYTYPPDSWLESLHSRDSVYSLDNVEDSDSESNPGDHDDDNTTLQSEAPPLPPTSRRPLPNLPAKVSASRTLEQQKQDVASEKKEPPDPVSATRPPLPSKPRANAVSPATDSEKSSTESPKLSKTGKIASSAATKPLPRIPNSSSTEDATHNTMSHTNKSETAKVPPVPAARKRGVPPALPSDLETAAMWHGDQGEGNKLMMKLEEEGTYMIRPSSDSMSKTLLVLAQFRLRKYKIHVSKDGKYSLQEQFTHQFDTVHQLLSFYRDNSLPNHDTKLTKPYIELTMTR